MEEETWLEFGDLRIDKEKVMIIKNGEQIDLARKELELLMLLVSKPGKVFSREEIFNKIWGNDVIVGNRTIDVHIRKLREKIGDDFIKTIGTNLVAGREISSTTRSDSNNIMLNEAAVRMMGLKNPIGAKIRYWGTEKTNVAVVKDFVAGYTSCACFFSD